MKSGQLEEMVEDDPDLDDDDFMTEYRQARMAEMKEKSGQHKFHGGVIDVVYESYA